MHRTGPFLFSFRTVSGPATASELTSPRGRPSLITSVLGFDSRQFWMWQACRVLRPRIVQTPCALVLAFCSQARSAVRRCCRRNTKAPVFAGRRPGFQISPRSGFHPLPRSTCVHVREGIRTQTRRCVRHWARSTLSARLGSWQTGLLFLDYSEKLTISKTALPHSSAPSGFDRHQFRLRELPRGRSFSPLKF